MSINRNKVATNLTIVTAATIIALKTETGTKTHTAATEIATVLLANTITRAWTPDGTPVVADPEEYTVTSFSHLTDRGASLPPGTRVRRWVSDWEVIE